MTKEQQTLKAITKYLDEYAKTNIKNLPGYSKEEIAEIKAKKELALELLVRFRLCDYAE